MLYRLPPVRVWTFREDVAGLHRRSVCASACVPNVDRRKLTASAIQCSVQSGLWKGPKQQGCFCYSCGWWQTHFLSLSLKAATTTALCLLSPLHKGSSGRDKDIGGTQRVCCIVRSFFLFFFSHTCSCSHLGLLFFFISVKHPVFFFFFMQICCCTGNLRIVLSKAMCATPCFAVQNILVFLTCFTIDFFFFTIIFLHHNPSSPSGWQCQVQSLNESLEGAIFILSCWEDNTR